LENLFTRDILCFWLKYLFRNTVGSGHFLNLTVSWCYNVSSSSC